MAGRKRTASRPSKTLMLSPVYSGAGVAGKEFDMEEDASAACAEVSSLVDMKLRSRGNPSNGLITSGIAT
jgi:hypothetical protein